VAWHQARIAVGFRGALGLNLIPRANANHPTEIHGDPRPEFRMDLLACPDSYGEDDAPDRRAPQSEEERH
jgi:hypothetical protein